MVFSIIKFLTSLIFRIHNKIQSIEKTKNGYIITFAYTSKRQIFKKNVTEVIENEYLLNSFSAEDALLIGFYFELNNLERVTNETAENSN